MRLFITAGFDRAPNANALCDILSKRDHEIVGICVVTPFNWKRFKRMLRQQGPRVIGKSMQRIAGVAKWKSSKIAPGPLEHFLEAEGIEESSLKKWAAMHAVDYRVVKSLNGARSVDFLKQCGADVVLYGGGGILRKDFIQAVNGNVLNAHSGPLPEIRGMNACEWSMIFGLQPHVTIHFINEGIDTGKYLMQIPVPLESDDTLEDMREKCVILGIRGLINAVERLDDLEPYYLNDPAKYRQCFVMAPAIREILDHWLNDGRLKLDAPSR